MTLAGDVLTPGRDRFHTTGWAERRCASQKAGAADVEDVAAVLDWDGLLLQLANELMNHFISRAK